jgi:hypothetical protein
MVADPIRGFVHEDWAQGLDFSTLEPARESGVAQDLREREDDLASLPNAAAAALFRLGNARPKTSKGSSPAWSSSRQARKTTVCAAPSWA